jgi:tetratricopeptide (TPR) repeat protein
MWALALLLGTLLQPQDALSTLSDQQRWDEIIWQAEDRLEQDPADAEARYWLGRASVERARLLLQGRSFSRDLAVSILRRAREQLARVPLAVEGVTSDAAEWEAFARFLMGGDTQLAQDLERWFEQDGNGYAAHLRGMLAEREGDASSIAWFEHAAMAAPDRPSFALEWAGALARAGRQAEALVAWEVALDHEADLPSLLGGLLSILPTADDAAARLTQLDTLLSRAGSPDDGLLAWYRAFSMEQLGRLDEAEQVMSAATSNRTWDVDRAHASLLERQGRRAEAAALLAPAAGEGDRQALDQLINLGDSAAGERAWDEALGFYDVALGIEPMIERATLNRALLLAQSGRSLDAYSEAVKRYDRRADVLNDAALAAWGWQRLDTAQGWFTRAAKMPGASDARENLAALLLTSGLGGDPRVSSLLDTVLTDEPGRDRALFLRHMARLSTSR